MTPTTLDKQTLELLDRAVLCWLATADPEGFPNVSPKEIFCAASPSEILVANIASPKSRANIRSNPAVCLSVIDIFDQRGVKITATARIVSPDAPEFDRLAQPLIALAGPGFKIRDVFALSPVSVHPIIAPSWYIQPEVSDAARRHKALAAYGVVDAEGGNNVA